MNNGFITGSLIDIISFAVEVVILLWFFSLKHERREVTESPVRRAIGFLPLIALLGIYMTPLNAAVSVFSLENLAIQLLRMILHLVPVMCWLILNKDCTNSVACYLAAIFTAIYLTSQNLRMVMMTYGTVTPPHQTKGAGYIFGLCLVALMEMLLAAVTRRLIKPERIDLIDRQRVIMMTTVLLIMVYFKWILTAVRELNLGGNRVTMVSFSLVTSIGLYLVILLYDYSRLLLKEKEAAEHEQMVLMYEVRSAKREMQASADIRRLYHDVKNHLLAIQSMAGSEGEIDAYLKELLPQFEGYETQVRTGSQTVDAILSEKIQRAYSDGIRFNICLDLAGLGHIRSVDLVTIFGNAVDNAVEALKKTEGDKYLYIKSTTFANNVVIKFENRFSGEIALKNGRPVTSKRDSDMHGIGISSIENAAGRYGGTVTVKADNENKQFTLIVMLPADKVSADEEA
ncbi:MAG: GHKL domain-containing protein [Mogibacterium sp.]|nr:GHKL domain-containing protein [Mogibacterium sp.]